MLRILAVSALAVGLAGCDSGPRAPTESDEFNVYFYYPSSSNKGGQELYLGKVTGISACQRTAGAQAAQENMTRASGWGYICCRIYNGSSCYSKHR